MTTEPTSFALSVPMTHSSFIRRFAAVIIDAFVIIIPAWAASMIIPYFGGLLVALLYEPFFEASRVQATPGKRAMGIIVTDMRGKRITLKAAMIRYAMKIVSSLLMFLGHFMALFTEKKQALHDLVAETQVCVGELPGTLMDAWIEQVKGAFSTPLPSGGPSRELLDDLERLKKLRDQGALTEEEFQAEKMRILTR